MQLAKSGVGTYIFLSVKGNLKETFQCETPCICQLFTGNNVGQPWIVNIFFIIPDLVNIFSNQIRIRNDHSTELRVEMS